VILVAIAINTKYLPVYKKNINKKGAGKILIEHIMKSFVGNGPLFGMISKF